MIKYYRKNDSKALKHYIGSLLSVFFQEKNILKFLKLKDKSIFVKDFFISTKVRLKKMEHLHQKETFSWDPYFSKLCSTLIIRNHSMAWKQDCMSESISPQYALKSEHNSLVNWNCYKINQYDPNFMRHNSLSYCFY